MSATWMALGILTSAYCGWLVSRKLYGRAAYAALMALSAFMQASS